MTAPAFARRGCADSPLRVCAVDWSGAVVGARRTIWLAEAVEGRLMRLENGRGRAELTDELIRMADEAPRLVVGLDFAFSLPAWFLAGKGLPEGPSLWELAGTSAEGWLAECRPPFWGKPGRARPELPGHVRRTDREVPAVGGIRPKSPFQVGGAGAVGTGSLRGMLALARLRAAGFSIWPFDPPGWPRVVEIYPRLLTGPVAKRRPEARQAYLARHAPELLTAFDGAAVKSDDAFDAAISARVMARHGSELASLAQPEDLLCRVEGQIWRPGMVGCQVRTSGG